MQGSETWAPADSARSRQVAVLITSAGAQVTVGMVTQALAPLAILVQGDLGLSRGELGLLLATASVGQLAISLPSGWLTDLFGVRRVLAASLFAGGILFALIGLTTSLWQAVLLLVLAGAALGFISPSTTKAIMYWFPLRLRGTAMGIKQTGFPTGGVLAAAVLPTAALALGGWRGAITAVGVLALGAGALCLALYHEHPHQAVGRGGEAPGLPHLRRLLRDPAILRAAGFAMCACVAQASLMGYLSLYLQEAARYSIVLAGTFLALAQLGGAIGRVTWGLISDRVFAGRRRPVLVLTSILTAAFALANGTVALQLPAPALAAVTFVFGLVAIGWNGVYHTYVGEIAGRKMVGSAIGITLFASYIGVIAGPPIFGYVVDRTGAYTLAWGLLAVSALAGLALLAGVPGDVAKE